MLVFAPHAAVAGGSSAAEKKRRGSRRAEPCNSYGTPQIAVATSEVYVASFGAHGATHAQSFEVAA